jgi:hypothetical protein
MSDEAKQAIEIRQDIMQRLNESSFFSSKLCILVTLRKSRKGMGACQDDYKTKEKNKKKDYTRLLKTFNQDLISFILLPKRP